MVNRNKKDQWSSVPDSIEECMMDDPDSINLVGWVDRIEKMGKTLAFIVGVIGALEAIGLGIVMADAVSKFAVLPFVLVIGLTILTEFILYIVFKIISIHLISQAEIVNNTKMTAKLTAYLARSQEDKGSS